MAYICNLFKTYKHIHRVGSKHIQCAACPGSWSRYQCHESDENGNYCSQIRIQTEISCHSRVSALTITLPRLPDAITLPMPPFVQFLSWDVGADTFLLHTTFLLRHPFGTLAFLCVLCVCLCMCVCGGGGGVDLYQDRKRTGWLRKCRGSSVD